MSRIFPILIVFCMIFVSCATAPERKTEEKKEKPVPVESEYGIRVTPESVEIYEVQKGVDEDFDKLFAMKRAGADIIITYHAKEALEKGLV